MALAEMKKIQLLASAQHKDKILDILQNTGAMDVTEINEESELKPETYKNLNKLQKTELTYANLEFAINLLSNYGKKKGLFDGPIETTMKEVVEKEKEFDYDSIIKECTKIEEDLTKAKNDITVRENNIQLYGAWKSLDIDLQVIKDTDHTKVLAGSVKSILFNSLIEKTHKISDLISSDKIHEGDTEIYFILIFSKELEEEISKILSEHKFSEADFPQYNGKMSDYLTEQRENIKDNQKIIEETEKELKNLAKSLDDLKTVHDYFQWQKEKLETGRNFGETDHTFVIQGWVADANIPKLEEKLEKETKEFEISKIEPKEGEHPPVVLKSNKFMSPFEAVTRVYGLPRYDELDPTPFLAIFFIIFFALCLTDAGYGIIMFIVMALILKKFRLPEGIRNLVRLLMYAGIVTFFMGAIFGGWFGLTPDQVPEALTYTAENGEQLFIFQKINAITNPILVLILSLALGFIQVLLGVVIKMVHDFRHNNKKDAILGTGSWVFMLTGIGFFIVTSAVPALNALAPVGKWWVIAAAGLLILTQGREKPSIIGKAVSGVLSLYGLVGYMGDILSYSRLLALGLATAIIGLAVNTVAALVGGIPYVGWLIMAVVFIGGHIFNLLINALGSFIHSGRLQFVEFFTKFMEGGGQDFKPFSKKTKYVYIKK
ncbi:MAG: V-type ATP synthase subunit I [Nitrospirota bacterium]